MKLKDKPVYPATDIKEGFINDLTYRTTGLTYREWLIGMIASGDNTRAEDDSDFAKNCIKKADAIIKEMEAK